MDVDFSETSATASCSNSGGGSSPPRQQQSLNEQHRKLTEEMIQLKCNIADQKGKQGLMHLDWQKLRTEQSAIQDELAIVEKECNDLRSKTDEIQTQSTKAKILLDQITAEQSPEQQLADNVKQEYDSTNDELKATQLGMDNTKLVGEKLRKEIEGLKLNAAKISTNRATLSTSALETESEIAELHEEIFAMQQFISKSRAAMNNQATEVKVIRKQSEQLAKQNETLESKIAKYT